MNELNFRIEKDALGEVEVPVDSYAGSFTARALENFNITGFTVSGYFKRALAMQKRASLYANTDLGLISEDLSKAIDQAIDDFLSGTFDSEFVLDYFQAGAGTPFNMNFNEIIANRANEILGAPKGSYKFVHPNNHVNMSQSSNDVIPTAIRICALLYFKEELRPAVIRLIESFRTKAKEGKGVLKVGRTHLEDAVPMTVEQEFMAFARSIEKSLEFLMLSQKSMFELGLSGTALGSGITSHPEYSKLVVKHLRKITGIEELFISEDLFEMSQSCQALGVYSSALRGLANDYIKIANDLKLLNMGPNAGIAEIILPEVEPGSSIMPGKVNPSVAEAVHMVGVQVIGLDSAVQYGVNSGQLQLNVMTPMILFNLELAAKMLKNTADMWRVYCVDEIVICKDKITELLNGSLVFATALVPYLGYQVVAELVNEALNSKMPIADVVVKYNLIDSENLNSILNPMSVTSPSEIDVELRSKLQESQAYREYLQLIGK